MRLWDTGVKLYALPYYATATTLKTKADVLAKFLRRAARAGPMPAPIATRPSSIWSRNSRTSSRRRARRCWK